MDFEVIDCHVHPFLSEETHISSFGAPVDSGNFVSEMKRAGVSRCCGSVIRRLVKPEFEEVRRLNREALEFRRLNPGFFIPGVHIHPSFPEESCQELERLYKDEGVRWVGELVGYFMDFPSYSGAGISKVYDLIQELGIPVNIHTSDLNELDALCKAFPKLKIVLAHPGDGEEMKTRVEFVKTHANMHLDISGTGLFRLGMLRHCVREAGRDKILFGTDFPVCNPAMYLQGVLFERLEDAELEAVLSGNFKRLTGML